MSAEYTASNPYTRDQPWRACTAREVIAAAEDARVIAWLNDTLRRANDALRVRAYYLWEAAGRPEGRELEFWAQAERQAAEQATMARGFGGSIRLLSEARL